MVAAAAPASGEKNTGPDTASDVSKSKSRPSKSPPGEKYHMPSKRGRPRLPPPAAMPPFHLVRLPPAASPHKVPSKRTAPPASAAPPPPWPIMDRSRRPGPNPVVVFSIAFVVIVALAVAAFFQVRERVEAIPAQRRSRQAAVDASRTSNADYSVPTTHPLTDNTEEATLRTVLFLSREKTRTPAKKGRR
ncbi:hypothetical protein V5799_005983 [Amblyomma americanum]|uniref:Uncharacterized protein n=1 Tax=Amblyomma americanum TaxID=6943 RepID=A0AAQ4DXP4_AMBAM